MPWCSISYTSNVTTNVYNVVLYCRGIFTAVGIIYKEQGVKGFFCGLIPRLLCDLTALWLGKTLAHVINNYLLEDRDLKQYVSASMNVSIITPLLSFPLGWVLVFVYILEKFYREFCIHDIIH